MTAAIRQIDTATGEIVTGETITFSEQQELTAHEGVIERGLQTFYEVGNALLAIRDKRLYRQKYPTFEAYCEQRWGLRRNHAYRYIDAAEVVANLGMSPIGDIPANEAQTRPLTELEPEEQRLVWQVVQETAPDKKITAAHVKSVVAVLKEVVATGAIDGGEGFSIPIERAQLDHIKAAVTEETYERLARQQIHITERLRGTPAALQMSNSNEWYTPESYIESARRVMGEIDLDPASNPIANKKVKAARFFTIHDDGLVQRWNGRVWLNPPYGRDGGESNQARWSARLIEAFCNREIEQAVLLVNAVTDREWFQPLWSFPICFTDHRIRFYNEKREFGQPTHGNALVYLGASVEAFVREFVQHGVVVTSVERRP